MVLVEELKLMVVVHNMLLEALIMEIGLILVVQVVVETLYLHIKEHIQIMEQ